MKRKDLTTISMMISKCKKLLVSMGYTEIFQHYIRVKKKFCRIVNFDSH